jgi:hypothetical protein
VDGEEDGGPILSTDPRLAAKERAMQRTVLHEQLISSEDVALVEDVVAAEEEVCYYAPVPVLLSKFVGNFVLSIARLSCSWDLLVFSPSDCEVPCSDSLHVRVMLFSYPIIWVLELLLSQGDMPRLEDGITIEPFNLNQEREEGYFDAEGNYVEYRLNDDDKVFWFPKASCSHLRLYVFYEACVIERNIR